MTEDIATVTIEELTRFYLKNHFLASRADKSEIVDVVGRICGLHSQLPITPYYSFLNRVDGFKPDMLDHLLYKDRSLVKAWFMRGTLHVIPSKDLPVYHNALRRMWFEHHGRYMNEPGWPSREERENMLHPRIMEALAKKSLSRKEICSRVRASLGDDFGSYEKLFSGWGGVLKETSYRGLTVHAEPYGRESSFARLDNWLPSVRLDSVPEADAKRELLRKYLHCYGPASVQDFVCWSGLLAGEANKAIEESRGLKQVRVEGSDRVLWMLENDFRSMEEIDLEEPVPPRLLPKYDSYLMGHKDRSRIIRDDVLQKVYRPIAGVVSTVVLINGRIVGTWKSKKTRKTLKIAVQPLEKLPKDAMKSLEPVADEMAAFLGVSEALLTLNSC